MQDRFRFRIVVEKPIKTMNGNFKGNYIYYCNGFIQTKTKTYFFGDNKRLSFLNSQIKSICQCTGLKDKNGKLIFEADILKYKTFEGCGIHSKEITKIGFVRIPEEMFIARCFDKKNHCTAICQCDWEKSEIIGNIYENPELLESEAQC